MFAPPVAKPKAMQPQRSTVVAQRPSQSAVSQAHLLQRSIGNQAMIRLLAQRGSVTRNEPGAQEKEADSAHTVAQEAAPSWDFSKIPVFSPGRAERFQMPPLFPAPRLPIQAKLKVGAVNDPLEHEADRVADQVMRMPTPDVGMTAAPAQVSRKCAACEEEEKVQRKDVGSAEPSAGVAPASVHEVLRAPGLPLDSATRASFEPRFGHDFSRVRVHTDAAAAESARDVNAHAYTVGHNIVFGAGQFALGTHEGERLLAHELTHVVQQSLSDERLQRKTKRELPVTNEHIVDLGSRDELACCDANSCPDDKNGVACPDDFDCAARGDPSAKNKPFSKTKQKFSPHLKCDGKTCKDGIVPYTGNEPVVALPSGRREEKRDKCGQKLGVCANGMSVEVTIREYSNRDTWEASPGVAAQLNVSPDFHGSIYSSANDQRMKDDPACAPKPKPTPQKPKATPKQTTGEEK